MKFLSDILAKAGLTVDGVVTLNNTATGQTPAANDNSTKLATTAWVRTFVQPYSLPIASATILGGIKVGSGLSIDSGTGVLSVTGGGAASIKSTQTFIATQNQTIFTISGGYTAGLIDVFLNGVYLSPNQTTATNGTTVVLNEAAAAGDIIDVIVVSPIYEGATTTTDQLPEGVVNLYYTNARARAAITLTVNGSSGASSYSSSTGVLNVPTYTLAGLGGIGGSGTTGYVSKFTNSTTIGNSLIYDDGFGIGINTSSPYNTSFYSLDVNGALLVKNVGKAANITLINADPAGGGNNAFVIHTVGGTLTSSYVDIQGYYGASVTGSTTIRLNAAGGNLLVGSLIGTGTRMVVASSTGILSSQAIPTISDLSGVPTSRTLTINGVTYDLTANRSWSALPVGGTSGQLLAKVDGTDYNAQWINEAPAASYTSQVKHQVKSSQAITKGQAVYVSSADGTNMIVSKASNATEGTSSKTMGLLESTVAINGTANVVTEGLLAGLNTTGANAAGDPVWLGTDGNLIYGLTNKPSAPAHLVFIGVVTRRNANNGEIFVKVQNGYELDELHDLSVKNASDGDMIKYVASTGLWTKIAASTTNIVEGTNLYYTQGRFDTAFAAKSTTNLAEGTNLYYTDARVGTYLTNNSYATQTYVNTAVSNLVDAAPGTLNTLNELAAALGDDPNFATTVAASIGTKEPAITAGTTSQYWRGDKTWQTLPIYTLSGLGGQPQLNGTGFVKVSGTTVSYDNSTYYLASNPSGYITGISFANVSAKPTTIAGYGITDSLVYTTSTYSNPSWITALAWSKITGAPAFITGYTETDTLASVTARGQSTSTAVTFNAAVTFAADKYQNPNSEYAIDLRNSDIIGTNAIYFNDNAESSGEGLNFWRSAGFWDTLRAEAGVLYFAPNRATASASTGFTVYHSGNLTNLNQLTNGPGYISSYTETDTLASVTARGASTSTALSIAGVTITSTSGGIAYLRPSASNGSILLGDDSGSTARGLLVQNNGGAIISTAASGQVILDTQISGTSVLRVNGNQTVTILGNTVWHQGNLTNLNQLSNGPGYITGYIETDTLASVTGRGATFNTNITSGNGNWIKFYSANETDSNDGKIGSGPFGSGLNIVGSQTTAGTGRQIRLWGTVLDSGGNTFYHSGNLTNLNQLTNGPGYITSASWSGLSSGYRENYDLGFRPPDNSSSYAGFRFGSPGNDANAGYFLIRGGSDNDVYTQNGITLVADLGWLTLAQRTTANRGVRIMTGSSTSTERARFLTDGQIQFINGAGFTYNGNTIWHAGNLTNLNQLSNGPGYITGYTETDTLASVTGRGASTSTLSNFNAGLTSAKTSKTAYGIHIKGGFYGAPRLQLYDLAVDGNAFLGLGTDMSGGSYEFSNYFPRYSGYGRWSVGSWAGDFGTGQYVSGYNEKFWITENAAAFNISVTVNGTMRFTDTTNGIYKSGDRLTVRSESTDNVANFANYGLYLPVMSQTAGLYVESPIEARGGLRMGSGALNGTITVGATTGATADRLVQRDGGGDIYSRYSFAIHFNASCPNNENPSIGGIWANSTSDNYLRKSTPAHFISQLGLITTSNIGSQSVTNSSQLNGISKVNLWNNSGQVHGTYQTFGAIPNFGVWFMQGSSPADTPQSASQYYVTTQGLGTDYGYGTTPGNYALMTAVARDHAVKYTYYRTLENGNWGAWTKAAAGYADTAGTAGSLSSMNISQFTNNSGYVTTSGLSTNTDSEQQAGLRYLNWNEGIRRMNTDPRWNESGYDGDLGCLHIWAWTAGGVAYGRAGIALYNDGAYQYLTTKSGTTGLFSNNSLILTASNISSYALTTGGGTVTGTILSSFDNSWALRINRSSTSNYLGITYATGGALQWYLGPREDGTHTYRFYNFNTTINAWSIDVNGNCTAYADVTAYSDFRVKKDITPITTALNKTLLLKGVSYKRTDVEQNKTKIGFIAQDVKEVLPEVVTYDEGADRYGVSYGNITALLVEAIKEQQGQIESQKSEIDELKDLVKQLINR
jgi:hypothetical protein